MQRGNQLIRFTPKMAIKTAHARILKYDINLIIKQQEAINETSTAMSDLHVHIAVPLQVLTSKVRLTIFFTLCQRHIQWLASNDAIVHVRHGLRGFIGTAEAHKAEAFRSTVLHHHLVANTLPSQLR